MKKFLQKSVLFTFCLLACIQQIYAQSAASILSTNPTANNDYVSLTSNVSVTYNDIMIAPSASNSAMRVFGDKRGAYSNLLAGTYTGNNTSTITYNPNRTFFPGELLSVVNNNNTTNGIINSRPTNFFFWAAAGVGLAQFTASTTSSLGLGVPDRDLYEIQNADLDNDGDLDIVFSRSNSFGGTTISYSLNNGSGAFGTAINLIEGGPCCFGNYVTAFTLGDYNHDGDVDIAVSYSVTDAGSNYYIARFSNNGSATFTQTDYARTEQFDQLISVDMDADGDIDLVGANRTGGTVLLIPNNVSGAFNLANVTILTVTGLHSIVAGDFNGDRRMDIASTRSTSSFIRISLQPISGTTYATTLYSTGTNTSLTKIEILDMESDGDLDLAVLNENDDLVVFMLNNAAGVFSTPSTVAVTGMSNFDLADYDGDGDLDLGFAAGNNSLQIYKNTIGTFASFSNLSLGTGAINNINQMCSGDFDGDGDIDVIGKPPVQNPSFGYPLRLLRNSNNQVFTNAVTSPTCVGNQITVSWTVSTTLPTINDFFIQLSDATGSFASPTTLGTVANSGTAGSLIVTIPNVTPGTGYRIRAWSNTAGVNSNDNGSNIQVFAGIDIAVSSFCDINSTYLSASSGTSGVTYSWSPATGLDITSGPDVVASPSVTTTYYCTGTSPLGCVDVDTIVVQPSCYCTAINLTGNCNAVNISQVIINSLNNSSGCSNLNGTAYNIYPASGNTTTSLVIGNTYTFSVRNGGTSNCTKVAWFDWDRNGTFDATEFVNIGTNIAINTTSSVSVTVPVTASSGVVGVRVREVLTGTTIGSGNACTLYSTGETEDYFITLENPQLVTSNPVENDNCFTTTSNLVYNFNTAMSNTATNAANYKIHGFKKGLYTATASGANTSTITYNPTTNLKPGERVMVTLTNSMQSTAGVNMAQSVVYEFVAKAGVGPATFLSEPVAGNTAGTAGDIGIADFTGDGNLDFVISLTGTSSTSLQFYTGNGAGGFAAPTTLTTPQTNPFSIEPADWDNDGDIDFIVGYNNVSAPQVTLFRNNGSGTFTTVAISLGTSSGLDIASADFDGDGDLDLVTVNAAGTDINYVRNNGAASFTLVDLTNTANTNFIVVPGDFNGDNDYDIAVADWTNSQIDIYTLKIGSGFSLQNQINTSGLVTALKANDFNGDGILDLTWTQFFTDSVGFMSGNGDFTFSSPFYYSLADPSQMDAADFDGDCDLDLAISSTTNDLYILKNDGNGNFAPQIGQSGGFSPVLVKSGDFDGDADVDLVAIKNSNNTASFLRNALVTVTTGTISGPICDSPNISVPWTANTTLTNIAANVELSDALGSFSAPTILLTTTLNGASGTITGVPIPIVTAAVGYRIRVRPTAITATTIDNGTNLGIGVSPNLAISSNCSGNNTLLNLSGAATYQWSPAAGLSSATSANVTAAPSSPTVYTYYGKDAGGCQSINYTVSVSDKCYCYPSYSNLCSSGDYISNVSLNTLVNNTGSCSGHQFNFTAVPTATGTTSLTRGSTYPISVTPNGGSFAQGIGVWMDFNQDNDYDDAGEFVYSAAASLFTVNGLVFIPVSANLGLTRMRVRAMYNYTPLSTDACALTGYGETEDYIVTIACVNPTVYNVTGGGVICDGVGVSVGLNNSESTTNYTLYLAGTPVSSLQGTGTVLNFNGLTATGTYSIQAVSASGCSATMSGTATISVGTALEVASTNPISNNPSVTLSSNINTTFNTNVAPAAAAQTYFKVYGNQTGIKAGAYSLIGSNSLRLNPTNDFKPGEEISVTHISGTPGTTCNLDTGYTYRLTGKAGVGPATFNPYSNPAISSSIITGVTAADFNADGKVDYAFIGRSSNNLFIALNSGSGNFVSTTTIGLPGYQPSKINTGDFDNDGDVDLVLGASNSGTIRLYKNDGTGTFSLFSSNNSGYASNSDIEVADFNVDGFLDIVATAGTGTIQILRNDGAGTLNAISVINSSFNHRNLAVIDINKDGLPDVAATNTGDSFVDFFENNLNPFGNLVLGSTYSINSGIVAAGLNDVAVKDFDNDNDEDIVVGSILTGRIAVLLNNYPLPLTASPSILVGQQPFQIVTADFDGDSDIDIAVTDSASTNTFTLLKNNSGVFNPSLTGTPCNAKYIASADLDNDADIDLVGIDFNGNSNFIKNEIVYITTVTNVNPTPVCPGSNVTVTWTVNQNLPAGNIFTIELSDEYGFFGGTNILTTVTSQTSGSVSVTIPTYLYYSTNFYIQVTSSSTPAVSIPFGPFTIYDYPFVSNVNGSGSLFCGDPISISLDGSFEVLHYNVYLDGSPLAGFQGIPGTGTAIVLGQFSSPGVYTVEAIDSTTGCIAQMNDSVIINSGVEPVITTLSPLQNSIDINRNSNIDITFNTSMSAISSYIFGVPVYVWGDKTGLISGVWSLPNANTMRFNPSSNFKPGEIITMTITTGVNSSTGCNLTTPYVLNFTVKGAVAPYNFVEQYTYNDGNASSNKPVIADFNGDQIMDVAYMSLNFSIYKLNIKLGQGLGALGATNSINTTGYPEFLSAADFDNDGDIDLYTVGNLDVLIYINDGSGNFTEYSTGILTDYVTPTVADFNGDGYLDILANEFNSGISVIYINLGSYIFSSYSSVNSYFFGVTHFHADFDNDGDEDFGLIMPLNNEVRIYSNDAGSLILEQNYSYSNLTGAVVVNDFNGDHRSDIYFRRSATGDVTLINNGGFSFTANNNVIAFNLTPAGASDFDGDGDLDIPGANGSFNAVKGLNNGSGGFTYSSQATTLTTSYAAYGDMDGDFDIDMVTVGSNGEILVLLNQPASSINTVYTGTTNLCPGQAITVSYNASGTFNAGNNFIVQLSDASGSFVSPTQIGILTTTALSGNIACSIPAVIGNGANYLIRVISDNPSLIGSSTSALTITNFVTPTVSIVKSPAGAQCAGTNLTFTASPVNGGTTPSYQWFLGGSPISGANSSTYVTSSLSNGNQISCQMTSSLPCVTGVATSNTINVNVTSPSTVSVSIVASPSGSQCAGTNITFTATPVNGGVSPVYQWKVNGLPVGLNAATYSSTLLNNGDVITCELTSSANCVVSPNVTSNTIVQSITTPLTAGVTITQSPATPQCVGTGLTFTATPVNGGASPSFQWLNNGSPISGANSAIYSTTGLVDGDDISVIMTTSACALPLNSTSSSITVTVLPTLTPSVSISASANTICPGTNVIFTATPVNGGSTPVYEWRVNGVPQAGFTGNNFNSSTLVNGDVVRVRLTSSASCASPINVLSATITMIVNPVLVPSVSVSPSASSVCAGSNLTFTATPTNGGASPSYQWFVDGAPVGINQNTFSTSSLTGGEVVSVSLTSNALCASPSVVSGVSSAFTINPLITPGVSVNASATVICPGTTVLFSATPVNGGSTPSYQWRINGIDVIGAINPTFSTSTLNNGDNVTVRIVSSDVCASPNNATSTPVIIIVNPIAVPTVSIASNLGNTICNGQIVTFTSTITNGGTLPSYQWKINNIDVPGAVSNTFNSSTLNNGDVVSLVLASNATCASPASVTSTGISMLVNPVLVPSVSISTPITTNCENVAILFSSSATNQGLTPAYQWNINGNPVSGANASTFSSLVDNGDVVTLTMTSNAVCANPLTVISNGINMTANPLLTPTVTIAAIPGDIICQGETVSFTATASNQGLSPVFNWLVNGIVVQTGSSNLFNTTSLINGDVISCELVSSETCVTSATALSNQINMTVNDLPLGSVISGNTSPSCFAPSETYSVLLTPGSSYAWSVPSGATILSGATGPDNNSITVSFTNLNGNISVTETNSNGCVGATQTLPVTLSGCGIVIDFNADNTSICAGQTVTFTNAVTGSIGATDMNWNFGTGATPSSITGNGPHTVTYNTPGLISVTLTLSGDFNGTLTKSDYIQVNPIVTDLNITSTNATCGINNGVIQIGGVNGGTAPFNYDINGGGFSSTTLYNGLSSGVYNVTVNDNNGCSYSENVNIINVPGPNAITTSLSDATCGSSNGSINVSGVVGGTSPYNYSLDGVSYAGSTLFSGLAAGSYTIFVRDANNCVFSQGFSINNLGGVTSITTSLSDATCGSSNGSINVSGVVGGTSPYNYSLDGVSYAGSTLFSGLAAGSYTIFVRDANNCVFSQGFSINNLGGVTSITTSLSDATCGSSNGSINVSGVVGGTSPYNYSLDGVSYAGSTLFSGLAAGSYTIFVRDANNCVFSQGFSINNLGGVTSITTSLSDATCGSSNGSINVSGVVGGTSPYNYSLDGVSYAGSTLFSGLAAGSYTIFVRDANNCVFSQGFSINNLGGVTSITTSLSDATCGSSNGSINVSGVVGGTSPYNYSLDGVSYAGGTLFSGLAAGSYTIFVRDANNCAFSQGFSINSIGGPTAVATTINNENCGNSDGSLVVTGVTSGVGPFSYNFNNLGFSLNTTYLGLSSGTYTLLVQDANTCIFSTSVTVGNNAGPSDFTASVTNSNCGTSDGEITVTSVLGGTAPYSYSNDGINFSPTNQFTGLGAGIYNIYVRDNNGCEYTEQATIGNLGGLTVDLFPTDETCGFTNGFITTSISGGIPSYNIVWSNGETTQDIFGLSAGNYSVTVTDASGCVGVASTTINNTFISLSAVITDATCGNNNGAIDLTASGGDGVYSYFWSNGEIIEDIDSLIAGTYDIIVNDYTGCTANATYNIGDTPSISNYFTNVTDATCGSNNGAIDVNLVVGGTAPYNYSIDGVSQGSNNLFLNLSSGSYLIKVADAFGCEFENTVSINTTPSIVSVNTNVQDETCGELNGSFTILSVNGGVAPYTYSFNGSPFSSQTFYTGLNNGIYNYEVIDDLGCNYLGSVTVASIGAVTSINTIINPETCGALNGSIEVTAAFGGTPPYEYALNSGAYSNNPIFTGLPAGNDTIYVKDNIGCIFQQIVTLSGTPAAVANAGPDITVCENSSVTLTATGGVNYSWDNGLGNSDVVNFTAISTNNYVVEVTDGNGCTDADTVTVSVNVLPPVPTITASGPTTFCFGNSVDLTSSYVGGNTWSTSATSDIINISAVGVYNIDVTHTDANGCSSTSAPIAVTVNALPATPIITASGPTTFCFGNSVDLTSSYIGGNTWSTSATSDIINISAVGVYNIDVTQTDANGCSSTSAPIEVTVNALPAAPIITASGPTTFCFGNSVDLTSSYVGGNTWSTSATSDIINISAVGVNNIDVTHTDANGCSSTSAPIAVTVNALPATPIITASGPTTFCFGNSVDLTSSYIGGNTWSTSATSDIINISAVGVYNIDVTQTDANGCSSTSAPIAVTVNALPATPIITASGPTTFCFGNSVDLTSSYVGGNTWSTSATSDIININAVGVYNIDVTHTDANGCSSSSAPITVTVNALPATPIITASGPTTFCFGNSVDLTSSYIGGNTWSTSATSDIINISAVGVYNIDVTQTDANGCSSTSAPIAVTVNALPATPIITASGPTTFCFGNSVDLTSSYVGGNTWSTSATSDIININAVGVYNIDVTHTDANGCSSTSAPITVTVNALPAQPVISVFGSAVICNGTSVTLASNESSGNVWSNSETTQSISVGAAGNYTVTYTDINGCSQTSDAVQIIVNTPIPASFNLINSVACEGGAPVVLSGGAPAGGNYIGAGVISNILYPALLPGGIYNIDYIVNDANGCTSVASQNFLINSSPVINITSSQTLLCLNDIPANLSATPVGGNFSGNGVAGNSFDPQVAGPGIHSVTYQYTDINGCSATESIDIIVNALPQLTLLPINDLCLNSGSFALNNGFPTGGTYEIDGVISTEINTGTLSSGVHTLTYNYNPVNGCGNSISTQFTIHAPVNVSLQAFADICATATPLTLTGGIPAGGNYNGSGVLGGVFYPNLANPSNTITYNYTDINGCTSSAAQTINVIAPQPINFAPISPVCLNSSPLILNTAVPSGGIYSGPGVVLNSFEPSLAGVGVHTITYEITDLNGCISSSTQNIIVNSLPPLNSVSIPALCANSSPVTLTFAQPVGGVYSGTAVSNGMFDPNVSGSGTFALQYVYTDNNLCTDTVYQNAIVNAAPVVTQAAYNAVCENSGIISLNNGAPSGGVYSGNFVNNNEFNSNISGAGTFTITYTYNDANGCVDTANASLVVNSLPNASLSPLGNICNGAGNITLTNGTPAGGTYYGSGVTNGILDPALLSNGTQTLGYTYTNGNGCVDSTSITYNIYTLQANAGSDQSITCTTSALLQGQSNYSGIGTISYLWSPAAGLSSTNTQNTVASPSTSTNYILTVSDGVCSSDDTVLVVVSQPNFNLAVTPSAQLLNAAPFIVFFTNNTPSPSNYSFIWDFGDGTTYNGFQPVYHNYTSNGSFTVTLYATALGSGCTDTLVMSNLITCNNGVFCNDSANIYIDGVLIPNNSNYSTTICASQNFVLGCNTGLDYSYQWYFNGIPLQGGLSSTYSPSVSGYYAVAVEDSNCINLSSPVYVTVLPAPNIPVITSNGSNNFCGGGTMQLTGSAGYSSYLWSTGSTQSSITISTSGTYWVQGFDANGCFAQSLDFAVNGSNMLPQYICVATVDTLLNKNRVIWEKPVTTSIDSFVVYRESTFAGVYDEIGRVAYENISEFIDTASFPSINNNRYRLAILDSCGNMTTQGDIHATIKTWIAPLGNGDSLEVFFTKYVGIDSLSYTLYRGPSANNMQAVGSSYTFNGNANFYSIKDLAPPAYSSGYVYYQIRAELANLCSSDSNAYQQSISNTVGYANSLGLVHLNQQFEVNAYPNPNNGSFNISIESGATEDVNLLIFNQVGELIWTKRIEKLQGKTTLYVPLEQAAQGVYQLQVTSNEKVINKKIIVNK